MSTAPVQQPGTNEPILLRDDHGGIATLTLNRPKKYNALSEAMLDALQNAFDDIGRDKAIRVVVLAANGPAFCAGHDLGEMRAHPDEMYYRALFDKCGRLMLTLARIPQPVIARVHGIATAAGCQLVAACDMAVAEDGARFATSGIKQGLFCSTPSVAVSRAVGRKAAFEMLFTGDFVDAETAKTNGLINRAVPAAELDETVAALAHSIVEKPASAVALGKSMFYRQLEKGLGDAYDYAAGIMARNMMDPDAGEGIDAFLEKRKPVWRDA
ncbi:MAG: enoyl-CoA hydratase [Candidatus Eiseniibacteriota bacterium]